jgi:hypothetical protein
MSSTYLGNQNLKDLAVKVAWTPERIELLDKCKNDPSFFIKKYIKVVTLAEGVSDFKLWDFQEKLIHTVHDNRYIICTMPRQSGKCLCFQQLTRVRNKKTGETLNVSVGDFFQTVKSKTSNTSLA